MPSPSTSSTTTRSTHTQFRDETFLRCRLAAAARERGAGEARGARELGGPARGPRGASRLIRVAPRAGRARAGRDEPAQRVVAAARVAELVERERVVPVVERPLGLGGDRACERLERGGGLVLREQRGGERAGDVARRIAGG